MYIQHTHIYTCISISNSQTENNINITLDTSFMPCNIDRILSPQEALERIRSLKSSGAPAGECLVFPG